MSGPGSSQTGSNQPGASSSDSRESGIGQSDSRRAASSLELFLDLAFVFAISQIATYLAEHLTVAGSLRALLLAWFAWWQWTAFTWAGATIDLKERGPIRVMVLCLVPVVLICSVALPRALADEPLWFAGAYCLIQLWVLSIQWVATAANPEGQAALRKYVPLAAIAPLVLLGSAFLPETPRLWAWIVVALTFAGSALAAGKGEVGEWSVTASHFAERHSLFIIIALGEVLVAIGVNSAERTDMSALGVGALIAASAVACSLWWAYFAYIPEVFEHALEAASPTERGRVARDVGSFIHFPLVCGIIVFAVLAEHVVHSPRKHFDTAEQVLLAGAAVLLIGGFMAIQWRLSRTVSTVRLTGLASILLLAVVSGVVPGLVSMVCLAVILGTTAKMSAQRFATSPMAAALQKTNPNDSRTSTD